MSHRGRYPSEIVNANLLWATDTLKELQKLKHGKIVNLNSLAEIGFETDQLYVTIQVRNGTMTYVCDNAYKNALPEFQRKFEQVYRAVGLVHSAKARGLQVQIQHSPTGQILLQMLQG